MATPDDPALADGFYWMFSSLTGGTRSRRRPAYYVSQTKQVDVEADWATAGELPARGRPPVGDADRSSSATARMPTGKASKTFTVTNTGGAPVEVEFGRARRRVRAAAGRRLHGSRRQQVARLQRRAGAAARRSDVVRRAQAVRQGGQGGAARGRPAGGAVDRHRRLPGHVMDNRVVNLDGKVYSIGGGDGSASAAKNYAYDPVAQTWTAIADLPGARNAMTVGVVDGKIIATGGWGAAGPDATTWSYDPAANTWTEKADNPAPRCRGRSGGRRRQAVRRRRLHDGGLHADVERRRPLRPGQRHVGDRWPTTRSRWPSPPAAGSTASSTAPAATTGPPRRRPSYAFDPGANTWTAIADAPADNWASSFAVANGKLLVVGGSQGGAITNAGFAYDPATGLVVQPAERQHRPLPRRRGVRLLQDRRLVRQLQRDAGQRGAARASRSAPSRAADVSWMTHRQDGRHAGAGREGHGHRRRWTGERRPAGHLHGLGRDQGEHAVHGGAGRGDHDRDAAEDLGQAHGYGHRTSCQGAAAPLPGAVVQVDSWAGSWTFATDAEGKYAYWMDRRNNPLTMIVAKDGYSPQARTVRLYRGESTRADFTLRKAGC